MLFLTQDAQASSADKDFVPALMEEKGILLVCLKVKSYDHFQKIRLFVHLQI